MDYFNSHCGYVGRSGRECGNWAIEGSPVNLCMEHMREAYQFCVENFSTVSRRRFDNSKRCPECDCLAVEFLELDMLKGICSQCGYNGNRPDFPDNVRLNESKFKDAPAVVYYIKHGDRIKIGTSQNWKHRITELPHDELLALEPGDRTKEQQRHREFADTRVRRTEWFTVSDDLVEHIASVRSDHPDFTDSIKRHNATRAA